jgi:hypothetical protein
MEDIGPEEGLEAQEALGGSCVTHLEDEYQVC